MRVLLGITGGIAAYKAANLIRGLSESGHDVTVVPTENALRFIGKTTLEALSGKSIDIDLYSDVADVKHVALGQSADLIVVAPATASFLSKLATGFADDLLMNSILAASAPLIVCPAMHTEMWLNPATQKNVETLRSRGVTVMEPGIGRLTGDDSGPGRLPETDEILSFINRQLPLAGKRILVTAGGTREPIDEVRYIGNKSSGKQGVAIAEACRDLGASVTLVACNLAIPTPRGVEVRGAETVTDLQAQMNGTFDAVVMAAAVSDFHVANRSAGKLPSKVIPNLVLGENPDVIASFRAQHPDVFICGFALEDADGVDLIFRARQKLGRKQLDLIVANPLAALGSGQNSGYFVSAETEQPFSGHKGDVAKKLAMILVEKLST